MELSPSISTDYSKYNDLSFLGLGGTLADNLEVSTHYTKPVPTVEVYRGYMADLRKAVQGIKAGLHSATLERDRARPILEAATRQWSTYATETTPARPDYWAEAGFPLTKGQTTPRTPAQPVTGFVLSDGNMAHSIACAVDRQAGMYGYLWRIRPKNSPGGRFCWDILISRTPDVEFTGLDSETAYCIECAAWNDSGPLQWSDALTRIVQ